jgi:HK97 family phage major capsid protein
MALGDFSGVIPPEYSTTILQEATLASAALQLCQTVPMGTAVSSMPVPKTLPTASWVTATGTGRKPYTDIGLKPAQLTAEEVAAVIAIPDKMIEDTSINLWGYCRPLLAQAIAMALDGAVIFGVNAPASFPAGGIRGHAAAVNAGADAADTINKAMAQIEGLGLSPDGVAADLTVRSRLRGLRATTGELILGVTSFQNYEVPSIYGVQAAYTPFQGKSGVSPADVIVGDWDWAVLGVRQDIRYLIDPSAVIADASGVVQVSGFTDNVTPMKVWARFGFVIIDPVTVLVPGGANAFAKADSGAASGTAPTGAEGDQADEHASGRQAKKAS